MAINLPQCKDEKITTSACYIIPQNSYIIHRLRQEIL